MINLTELEKKALADLWQSSFGNGHDFGFSDELPNIDKVSRGGVVSSLVKKDLIDEYEPYKVNGEYWVTQFKFTEKGQTIFSDFENSSALR